MGGMVATVVETLGARQRAWRRARNMRVGRRAPACSTRVPRVGHRFWTVLAFLGFVLAGAGLIAGHARSLAAARLGAGDGAPALAAFASLLPGVGFTVPAEPGVSLTEHSGGTLLVLSGMRAGRPVVIDLCEQKLAEGDRIAPIRILSGFGDVADLVARNESAASPVTLRNLVLAGEPIPRLDIGGFARGGTPLWLAWNGAMEARWVGDAGAVARARRGKAMLGSEGWLLWGETGALRLVRRFDTGCAAGALVLTRFSTRHQAGDGAGQPGAQVTALGAHGEVRRASLAPGHYQIPDAPPPTLEDGALFGSLLGHGLVRLNGAGMIEVAPRDLADWRAGGNTRAADLRGWDGVRLDERGRRLLERLHGRADGAYVREQIRIFNGERRLLAWRLKPGFTGTSGAEAGGLAAAVDARMPPAAARLFDSPPQGWGPWQRVADWPGATDAAAGHARLTLHLPHPARGGEHVHLLLAGRLLRIDGASIDESRDLCRGHGCAETDEVRELDLVLDPGARHVVIDAVPLDLARIASADAAYRHVVLKDGRLAWQALPRRPEGRAARAEVKLADRHGYPLWDQGKASDAARGAGLAPLLGLRADHASSLAGMLGRLPSPDGAAHTARLTLDLGLQRAAQGALDCVGLRLGTWDGSRCHGGGAAAPERQAGLVLLDTASGDILAAASAGGTPPDAIDWTTLRDFDRADPARSPLRQAALQHDGGAERSPGSTFKIVTALGLELAAQRDARLDALLGGMPLADINALARERGFAFRTDAASYPLAPDRARITNFRDQHLDRRASDGRLGLAQALAYSLNTWFAWTYELSDASLFGRAEGGAPSLRALDPDALAGVRPVLDMAHRLGFERPLRLDGGLLPAGYGWREWDVLAPSVAGIDPIGSRHELRQMAIGLRMQATPLHMALAAGAVGEGKAIVPRLLLELDGRAGQAPRGAALGVRLDRIRAGLQGVVSHGTAAAAFRDPAFDRLRAGLYGKTGTAPVGRDGLATVWFTGWLEPGSLPGQDRRLAFAVFVSRSEATGGGHAAPVVAALLRSMLAGQPSIAHSVQKAN